MIIAPLSLSALTNQTPSLTVANQDKIVESFEQIIGGCSTAVTCKQVGYKWHKFYAKFVNEKKTRKLIERKGIGKRESWSVPKRNNKSRLFWQIKNKLLAMNYK